MLPPSPRHRVAIVIALAGVAVSAVTWYFSNKLAGESGYVVPGCTPSAAVDCGQVLTSHWGKFLGIPVAALAVLAFAVGALVALPGALGAAAGGLPDLALLGIASGSLGFAVVLLAVAAFSIQKACLYCLTLDAIILAWFVAVLPIAQRFAPATQRWTSRRATARAAIVSGFVIAVALGTLQGVSRAAPGLSPAQIQRQNPDFVRWWNDQPVFPEREVAGDATHAKGPADAPVTIVEFSDFQCPACRGAFGDLRDLAHQRNDVRIVFRHFPLDSHCNPGISGAKHQDACLAAAAAECAGQQGKFWEYHDQLFPNQQALDRESLFRYARETGLDIARFRTCLDDPATMDAVREHVAAGTELGIMSTPTLFINGRRMPGVPQEPFFQYMLVLASTKPSGGS